MYVNLAVSSSQNNMHATILSHTPTCMIFAHALCIQTGQNRRGFCTLVLFIVTSAAISQLWVILPEATYCKLMFCGVDNVVCMCSNFHGHLC